MPGESEILDQLETPVIRVLLQRFRGQLVLLGLRVPGIPERLARPGTLVIPVPPAPLPALPGLRVTRATPGRRQR